MSKLTDLYEASKTPSDDRIQCEKNILLVVPDKKHDVGPILAEFGLSPFEVSLTWQKNTVNIFEEIDAVEAKVVIQVDCKISRRHISVTKETGYAGLMSLKTKVNDAIADTFIGLHHHDEFSIKDGLGTVGSFDPKKKRWNGLIGLLLAQRRSFCCITNHGSVGGWIKQYNACKKAGVKALYGCEFYTSNYRGNDMELKKAHRSANHLVLIANTEEGFFNIIRIHNDAQLNGFYYTPRVNREALEKWGKGIVGMSACFPHGTNVFTSEGFVRIENVVGNVVVTHRGNLSFAKPTSRMYTGKMKTIKCRGISYDLRCTEGHELLVVSKKNRSKIRSDIIPLEVEWAGVSKEFRNARRRNFQAEWTSNVCKGDWLLFPVLRETARRWIDTSEFNHGKILEHRVTISLDGRNKLRCERLNCGHTFEYLKKHGSWTKANIYNVEEGRVFPLRSRLERYLSLIGIDMANFMSRYCEKCSTLQCGLKMNDLPSKIGISPELLFLLGAYCAEGNLGSHQVVFTLNQKEKAFGAKIREAIRIVFGLESSWTEIADRHTGRVCSCSLPLKMFFEKMCGSGAENKKVPAFVFGLPFSMQRHWVRGYVLGDGCRYKSSVRSNGRIVSASISEDLSMGLVRILLNGSYYPTVFVSSGYIGRDGTKHQKAYHVSIAGKQHLGLSEFIWDGKGDGILKDEDKTRNNIPIRVDGKDYLTSLVREVSKDDVVDLPVRCLRVDSDRSFIVNFASVHNCAAGELPRLLMEGKEAEAREMWEFHSRVLDAFYVEIQIIEAEEQREVNRRLIQFARSVGAPIVISNDSHYLDPEYAVTHDILMCLRQKKTIVDKREKDDVWSFDVRNLYYRNAVEMRQVFENGFVTDNGEQHAPFRDDVFTDEVFNEAIANTRKIAIGTQNIKLDSKIKLPKLYDNGKQVLREKINLGFSARGLAKKPNADEYFKRIKYEFEAITKMGWGDYFLIIERIITDTKEKFGEFSVGYGRGCFHPSMRVITENGMPKFISDVQRGDVVISHDGSKQKVLDTFEYDVDEELVEIEMEDGRVVRCTQDHLILVRRNGQNDWVAAKDIQSKDDIVEV